MALISSPEPIPVEVMAALLAAPAGVVPAACVVAAGAVALDMVELI